MTKSERAEVQQVQLVIYFAYEILKINAIDISPVGGS